MLKRLTQRQAWLGALAILALFFAGTGRAAAQESRAAAVGQAARLGLL